MPLSPHPFRSRFRRRRQREKREGGTRGPLPFVRVGGDGEPGAALWPAVAAAATAGNGHERALLPASFAVSWAADWDLAPRSLCSPLPIFSRLPSSASEPAAVAAASRAPGTSARLLATGDRGAGTAATAATGWPARPRQERGEKTSSGSAPGVVADRRRRTGAWGSGERFLGCLVHRLESACGAQPQLPGCRWAARGARGSESWRSAWGKLFTLQSSCPGAARSGGHCRCMPKGRETRPCGRNREVGTRSWPSLGLRIWGEGTGLQIGAPTLGFPKPWPRAAGG
jgi:hypothetical protein